MREIVNNEKCDPVLINFQQEFYRDRVEDYSKLLKCYEAGDLIGVKSIVHNWKGYCKPYGFDHLGLLSLRIEEVIIENKNDDLVQLLADVNVYLEIKKEVLSI